MSSITALPSAKPRILHPGYLVAFLVVALGIVGASVYAGTRSKADVEVAHPEYRDIATTVAATGLVVPIQDFPARANFSGLVDAIYVHAGQKVRAGQMLLRMKDQYAVTRMQKAQADLDDAELNEQNVLHNGSQEDRLGSQADLLKAQTERDQAAAALAAMRQIAKNGSVSGAELEAGTQRLQTAETNLTALKKKLNDRYSPEDIRDWKDKVAASKSSMEAERISWANANLSTPIAGTVYVLPTHLYDFVPAGTDLLHVADLSRLEVRANFPDTDLDRLKVGQPVSITWDGAPGRTWNGHLLSKPLAVTRVGDRDVGECTIALEDNRGDLPVDTKVATVVSVNQHAHVLTIPREALYEEGGARFVYRVVDGELKKTDVQIGISSPMRVEIAGGLKPEDEVMLRVKSDVKVKQGLRVTVDR